MDMGVLYLAVKRPGRKTHHLSPNNVEVKNGGAMPQFPYTSSKRSA
jgi:hypothetical protein